MQVIRNKELKSKGCQRLNSPHMYVYIEKDPKDCTSTAHLKSTQTTIKRQVRRAATYLCVMIGVTGTFTMTSPSLR